MVRTFTLGMCAGFFLLGCAGLTFPYKYYKPQLVTWQGALLGAKPEDDLDAAICAAEGACVVLMRADFFKLKTDYLDMKDKLNYCD